MDSVVADRDRFGNGRVPGHRAGRVVSRSPSQFEVGRAADRVGETYSKAGRARLRTRIAAQSALRFWKTIYVVQLRRPT